MLQEILPAYYWSDIPQELQLIILNDKPVWNSLNLLAQFIQDRLETLENNLGGVEKGAYISSKVKLGIGTRVERGAVILGPAIIGDKCQIRSHAYIRENCYIGNSCVVGHASELKNTILFNHAMTPHFNYVGDSVLGCRVNLGAGSILSNLRLDGKEIFIKLKDNDIPTGRRKLGAILGDDCQVGCNAVCNPGTLMGPNTFIFPNKTLKGFLSKNSVLK